jgi:hypothetical protein
MASLPTSPSTGGSGKRSLPVVIGWLRVGYPPGGITHKNGRFEESGQRGGFFEENTAIMGLWKQKEALVPGTEF